MATTSPDNLWSPDSPDDYNLVIDWAASMDSVQEALNRIREYTDDTGWLDFPSPVNGFQKSTLFPPQYRKVGKRVDLRGQFYRSTAPTSVTTATVLPSGFIPQQFTGVYTVGFNDGTTPVRVEVLDNGEVQIGCTITRVAPAAPGYSIAGLSWLVE